MKYNINSLHEVLDLNIPKIKSDITYYKYNINKALHKIRH